MVVTDECAIADLLRSMRSHGWSRAMSNAAEIAAQYPDIDPRFLFVTTGFNVRPREINAAIGLEQIKRLDGFNPRRREIAARFDRGFANLQQSGDLQLVRSDRRCMAAPFGYPVLCRTPQARQAFRRHLEAVRHRDPADHLRQYGAPAGLQASAAPGQRRLDGADRVMDCGIYWGPHPGHHRGRGRYRHWHRERLL